MFEKRRNYTREKHWQGIWCYVGWWRTLGVLIGILFVVITAWQFYAAIDTDDLYEAQVKVVATLQMQTPDGRMAIATNMIELHWHGIGPDALNDDRFLQMVEGVAQTGNDAWLTASPSDWDVYLYDLLPRLIFVAGGFASILWSAAYLTRSTGAHYLADLPWRKPWVWRYVLISPMLWIPLIVSAVYIHRHGYADVEPRKKSTATADQFEPDDVGAALAYREMRKQSLTVGREVFLAESKTRLAHLLERCTTLGKQIRDHQRERTQLLARVAQVSARDPLEALPSDDELAREFNRILQLPGVQSIRPSEKGIELLVNASIEDFGKRYDLGTWNLYLDWTGTIKTVELRTGVLPTWKNAGPVYRYQDEFCFGTSEEAIRKHLTEGQILEATARAVQCLSSVNKNHRSMISRAFKRLEGDVA